MGKIEEIDSSSSLRTTFVIKLKAFYYLIGFREIYKETDISG